MKHVVLSISALIAGFVGALTGIGFFVSVVAFATGGVERIHVIAANSGADAGWLELLALVIGAAVGWAAGIASWAWVSRRVFNVSEAEILELIRRR